jgi:hypothetical protein
MDKEYFAHEIELMQYTGLKDKKRQVALGSAIARQSAAGGERTIHSNSAFCGGTPTPTLPRKRRESHMTELSRTLMRSWPRTISQQVVPANAGTHRPWPQK